MTSCSSANIENLRQRSDLLRCLRQFFYDRDFVEVETPLLADEVIPEQHIEPCTQSDQYLQSSPELHMKQLVVAGMKKIFQVTRSFRADEQGPLHQPEFTIVEWYRTGDDLQTGMQLLDELCQAIADAPAAKRTSYQDAFQMHLGVCPHSTSIDDLMKLVAQLDISVAPGFRQDDRDEWLNLLLSFQVEPRLGQGGPEMLFDYPASQAALAKTARRTSGVEVAERFELYWQGVEIANGYHELTDAAELRDRLEKVNRLRQLDHRHPLPLPESLLTSMEVGMPDCAGCALGFDRLAMLLCDAKTIHRVMSFT